MHFENIKKILTFSFSGDIIIEFQELVATNRNEKVEI